MMGKTGVPGKNHWPSITDKLSHIRICPEWNLNLGNESFDPYILALDHLAFFKERENIDLIKYAVFIFNLCIIWEEVRGGAGIVMI